MMAERVSRRAPSVFGLTDHDHHYVVDTGAGVTFRVRKPEGALVTARRTGDHIVVRACATDAGGVTTYRYLVARKADPVIYLAVHSDDNRRTDGPRALVLGPGAAPDNLDFLYGLGLLGLPHLNGGTVQTD
jgi:hypothetical protein